MSDLFSVKEQQQFDDDLVKSIETLLDDSSDQRYDDSISLGSDSTNTPSSVDYPFFDDQLKTTQVQCHHPNELSIGDQTYRKWSPVESDEQQQLYQPPQQRFQAYRSTLKQITQPPHVIKSQKRSASIPPQTSPTSHANGQALAYEKLKMVEQTNQFFNQCLQLNMESLRQQASRLGVPLEQYIRNLLMASNQPSLLAPQTQQVPTLPAWIASNLQPARAATPQQKFCNGRVTPQFNQKR